MKYKITLDKKNGTVFDITNIVSKATITLKRAGSCGSLSLNCVKGDAFSDRSFEFENGDIIQLQIDDKGIFRGFVFKIENKLKDSSITVTAYDQIKYLLYNATYSFVNKKANEIIKQIAEEFNLLIGDIADTGFVIPKLLEDDKKLLDIITEALYITSDNGGGQYCLYDDFGKLELKALQDMKRDLVLSDTTHIQDATFNKDIEDSYNVFKIVQDNEATGGRNSYVFQNSEMKNKWGTLQYFEVADEGLNEAQIKEKLETLSKLKGREKKSFSIKSVGEFVRAGESIAIIIDELNIKQFFVIDEVKHNFEGGDFHDMDLTLYVA